MAAEMRPLRAESISMIILLPIWVAIAWACHVLPWRFAIASAASTVLCTLVTWAIAQSHIHSVAEPQKLGQDLLGIAVLAAAAPIGVGALRARLKRKPSGTK